MANRDLQDKYFNCSDEVIGKLQSALAKYGQDTNNKGYNRAKDIVDNKRISYQQMKRIKNYFDKYEGEGMDPEYILNGGNTMKKWVNQTLENSRNTIHDIKKVKMNSGIENAFKKTHTKDKDNTNITNVNLPKINKGSQYDNIMNNRTVYENLEAELTKAKYLIEYMNNNNKTKIL